MTIFHNYQTKYILKDFELIGVLNHIIWNIEEICLIIFPINDYEYHTIYWDINSEISKKNIDNDVTFQDNKHKDSKMFKVRLFLSSDWEVLPEFNKNFENFVISK